LLDQLAVNFQRARLKKKMIQNRLAYFLEWVLPSTITREY
jgi:hypothetical protein